MHGLSSTNTQNKECKRIKLSDYYCINTVTGLYNPSEAANPVQVLAYQAANDAVEPLLKLHEWLTWISIKFNLYILLFFIILPFIFSIAIVWIPYALSIFSLFLYLPHI